MNKFKMANIGVALLFFISLFAFIPNAQAFNWGPGFTTGSVTCDAAQSCFDMAARSYHVGQTVHFIGIATSGGNPQIKEVTCNTISASCSNMASISVFSTTAIANFFGLAENSAGQVAICNHDSINEIKFSKNLAGAWSSATTVASSVAANKPCGIAEDVTNNKYLVIYSIASSIKSTLSSDGGNTWAAPVTVTGGGDLKGSTYVNVIFLGANTYVMTYVENTGNLKSCKTTDSGTTWACLNINGDTDVSRNRMKLSYDDNKLVGTYHASTALYFYESVDNGNSWTITLISSSGISIVSDISIAGAGKYSIAESTSVTCGSPCNIDFYSTINGGIQTTDWTKTSDAWCISSCTSYTQTTPQFEFTANGNPIYLEITKLSGNWGQQAAKAQNSSSSFTTPTASVAVTTLVGVDFEPNNQVVIARTDGGENVRTYDPITLTNTATQSTADCGTNSLRTEGVAAYYDGGSAAGHLGNILTTYYNCAVDATVDRLAIRNQILTTPNQGNSICTNFCDIDFITPTTYADCTGHSVNNDASDAVIPAGLRNLGRIQFAAWDWSASTNPNDASPKHATVAWSYSRLDNGNIGVFAVTQNNENADCIANSELAFTAPSSSLGTYAGFCSFINQFDGKNTIVGAAGAGSAKSYEDTINVGFQTSGPNYNVYYPIINLANVANGGSPFTTPLDISCAAERWGVASESNCYPTGAHYSNNICYVGNTALVSVAGTGDVYHINVAPDSPLNNPLWATNWGPITSRLSSSGGSVAISADGHWGAYLGTGDPNAGLGTIKIVNATNNELRAIVNLPTELCCWKIALDDTGQTLWVATQTHIYKWDIHTATTVASVSPGNTVIFDGSGEGGVSQQVPTPNGNPPATITPTPTLTGSTLNQNDIIFGINVTAMSEGLNISRASALIFLAIMFIIIGFLWIYRGTESIIGGIFGAFLGFLLSVSLALLPQWVMISIVLILLIIFGKMIFGGFSGGESES